MLHQIERQRHDVFLALTQWRQEQRHNIQPVIKVFAKYSARDRIFEISIGGGDQAHVHFDGMSTAQAHKAAFFEHAQKLRLNAGRHGGDLVQKQRSPMRALQQAFFAAARVGEGARLEAKKFTLQQRIGQCGAIEFQQGHRRPRARVMNGLREHALAGPTLALQQDGGVVRFRGFACHFEHPARGLVQRDDFAEIVAAACQFHVIAHPHA